MPIRGRRKSKPARPRAHRRGRRAGRPRRSRRRAVGLYGDDVPVRAAAVLDPAAVRQDGAAGARRLAVGVGGGRVLLPGRAAGRLLLRASPDRARCRRARRGSSISASARLPWCGLPIGLPSGWSEPPPGQPYLWQLGLFTVAIGLPFLAVSANAPLLQAWFARTGHPHAHDPYFLYAASNLGSLIALLGLSVRAGAGVRPQGAERLLGDRLPAADRGAWRRVPADAAGPRRRRRRPKAARRSRPRTARRTPCRPGPTGWAGSGWRWCRRRC